MIAQLPAFIAYTLGDALRYELGLLVLFVLVLNIRSALVATVELLRRRGE